MNSSFKYIAISILVLLTGAFAFQVYWIKIYYNKQADKLELDILSSMRAADDQLIYQKGIQSRIAELEKTDFPVYCDLLQAELIQHDLFLESFTEMIDVKNNRILSRMPEDISALKKDDYKVYTYYLDIKETYAYRLYVKHPDFFLVKQMSGVLATSLLMILVLLFSYVYLLKIIYKQKTLDEIKSDFVNNMTHELKTPISIAYSANDALLNYGIINDSDKREIYLKTSQEQLMHLNGLVEQILTMSVEERKNMKLTKEEICLSDLFHHLKQQYTLNASKELEITVDVQPAGLSVWADKIHFQNMLSNLLENAIKYSGTSVVIALEARENDDKICLMVRDNGIGIPSAALPKLFDRFYRVPTGDVHDVKGHGLGLYYVKTIVEKHDWKIEVKSKEGEGTTFFIYI